MASTNYIGEYVCLYKYIFSCNNNEKKKSMNLKMSGKEYQRVWMEKMEGRNYNKATISNIKL